jgi:5-methylcytosine-specific restriction protein A
MIMAKEFSKAFYNSTAWKICRLSYIASVHGLCERCGEPGLILHHKEKLTPENINNPEVTLNFDKLEYLCQRCHNADELGEHTIKKNANGNKYYFDEKGDIVLIPPLK